MSYSIDNRTAQKIIDLAREFYSDPENVRKFEEWKLSRHGGSNEKTEEESKK